MRPAFYDDPAYRKKQSEITKQYHVLHPRVKSTITRICSNIRCKLPFQVRKPSDPKLYCGHSCATSINNLGRTQSIETRIKISTAIKTLPPGFYQRVYESNRKPKITLICKNLSCRKNFQVLPYKARSRKYCSNKCVMQIVGRMTTSPKAAKSKPGIRLDIDPKICFYSTWEANIARVFNLINLKWQYAPTIFDIGLHTYRPDFYLPESNTYIEVKNFMGEYSQMRDREFRKRYPNIKLEILSKIEYEQITEQYKPLIAEWE